MGDQTHKSTYQWKPPIPSCSHTNRELRILHSQTKRKEIFVSKERKTIKWYSCGPTVYDVAHLGHARCYITFDIIRRIMSDYFGYNVFYVMNITDIDDKIIKRARSNYLCDEFIESSTKNSSAESSQQLLNSIHEAIDNYQVRRQNEKDPAKLEMIKNIISSSKIAAEELAESIKKDTSGTCVKAVLQKLRDVIADEQDAKLYQTVTDHQIFKALSMRFEKEYHQDMQRLNVLPPSALTRVSEYIDETGEYIKVLEKNGFAYRSGGSVYFDTAKFDSDPKHSYAKLVREAYGCQKKDLDDGEGELSTGGQDKKRSPNDFALWKKSKSGEPSWQTQDLEAGRPGWHIECSVMASNLLGDNFDIHSGGSDLKFPHHDNEIAQAEAYYNTGNDWVNYFIHSGHLTISGCKMSKSLKNFITIRQALTEYTARQLRFAFLAHGWAETLDYSTNTMNIALSYERNFREFFLNVSDTLRRLAGRVVEASQNETESSIDLSKLFIKWTDDDHKLNKDFLTAVDKLDLALCDNFDTRTSLNVLGSLISNCNKCPNSNPMLLRDIANFVKGILHIFGTSFDEINLDQHLTSTQHKGSNSAANDSERILKYVEALAEFRAEVRKISKSKMDQKSQVDQLLTLCDSLTSAQQKGSNAPACDSGSLISYAEALVEFRTEVRKISESDVDQKSQKIQLLTLCDKLRDLTLPSLGVRLEDKEVDGAPFVVKLVDAETLAREKELAEKRKEEKKGKQQGRGPKAKIN